MLLLWKTAKPNRVIELEMNSFYLQICRCGNGLLTGQKASVATEKRVFLLHIVRYAKNNNWVVLIVNIFHIFFFKSARSDLFWIKAEFSIKELSILTRIVQIEMQLHLHSSSLKKAADTTKDASLLAQLSRLVNHKMLQVIGKHRAKSDLLKDR